MALAGLPAPREVVAGRTSMTCSCCGHRDVASRPAQDRFACTSCGFEAHADVNAAVQIARRGVMRISKSDKMDTLHMN
ncbi:zinc ribbon domain-containing protein, partial [Salmonella sp. SAL4438]|uniref:zinc ribbon domain-containing protein n=1 Tax=Salmonella sp. SAL4438 TaxID=3159893 RepID=UPI00397AAC67